MTTIPNLRQLFAATLLIGTAGIASAQDDGLYPAPSAPDASFLRVYAPDRAVVQVDGTRTEAGTDASGLTPYIEIGPGPVAISVGDKSYEITAEANRHYSVLPDAEAGTAALLDDAVARAAGQADLIFYNLSDIPAVDLYVPEVDTVALPAVAAQGNAGVALRAPLTLSFEARDGDTALAAVPPVELLRGTGLTVVLSGKDGEYRAMAETNSYDR
ncbi:MAG: DUF4397 domain-containing protein [Limimaricola soesokkakensis]|uniref:DUF4397 domain-containing protein n=1 Tax=Limimaricola soesokkakensis TaxID=1343159 RepID=UPI0040587B4E